MAILVVFALLFATANRPPAGAVQVQGIYYHARTVALDSCVGTGGSTQEQIVELQGVHFAMHQTNCNSVDQRLVGNASSGSGAWSFEVQEAGPSIAGWSTDLSPDGGLGMQYSGHTARALVRV